MQFVSRQWISGKHGATHLQGKQNSYAYNNAMSSNSCATTDPTAPPRCQLIDILRTPPVEQPIPLKMPALDRADVPINPPQSPEAIHDPVKNLQATPMDTTLTHLEERILTHTYKCKLHQTQSNIVQVKTGGQPITVQRLVKGRKPS